MQASDVTRPVQFFSQWNLVTCLHQPITKREKVTGNYIVLVSKSYKFYCVFFSFYRQFEFFKLFLNYVCCGSTRKWFVDPQHFDNDTLFSLKFIDLAGAKGKSSIILIVCSNKI